MSILTRFLYGNTSLPPPPPYYLLTAAHRAPHSTVRTPSFIQQPATNNRQRANGESIVTAHHAVVIFQGNHTAEINGANLSANRGVFHV